MKKITLFLVFLASFATHAQKQLSEQDDYVPEKALYLNYEAKAKRLNYFAKGRFDEQQPFNKEHQLSLGYTYSNLYMNWLNPLKYKITWKDSIYTDDRDQAAISFVQQLASRFGAPITGQDSKDGYKKSAGNTADFGGAELQSIDGAKSIDLIELYIMIRNDALLTTQSIDSLEVEPINNLLSELMNLDQTVSLNNIAEESEKLFQTLIAIDSPDKVTAACEATRKKIAEINTIQKVAELKTKIETLSKLVKVQRNPELAQYITLKARSIADKMYKEAQENKSLFEKLESLVVILESSVQQRESKEIPGFYELRNISFEYGKVLQTEITITEYEYKAGSKDYQKKADVYQSKIKFRKSDFVVLAVTAGVFFSQTTLKYYGVSSGDQMSVTEQEIEKNTTVTASFLNLFFNLKSRYFAPLIQLGIDPTKKHPFLLAGAGFSIPAASFAISGGPLWTWDAKLDKLSVDSPVETTTELESDVKYQFDGKIKGWYLGIQYNF